LDVGSKCFRVTQCTDGIFHCLFSILAVAAFWFGRGKWREVSFHKVYDYYLPLFLVKQNSRCLKRQSDFHCCPVALFIVLDSKDYTELLQMIKVLTTELAMLRVEDV